MSIYAPKEIERPREEWTRGGITVHGVRCTAKTKATGERCKATAVDGYGVCGRHGAGTRKRVEEGTKKPGGGQVTHGLFSTRMARNLRKDIEELKKKVTAADSTKRALATVELLLDVVSERVESSEDGEFTQTDVSALLTLANELSKAAKTLSDVQGKASVTFDDLVVLSKMLASLVIELSTHVPEGEPREAFLTRAKEGLAHCFGVANQAPNDPS